VEQVAGEYRVRLGPQELDPRWSGPPRRRVDSGGVQDGPDGGGADPVAETGEFAVEASVSPGRVLGDQAEDQGAQAGGDGGSTRSGRLGGPAAGDQLAVPAPDGGRCDQEPESSVDRKQSGECGDQGPVGPGPSRAWRAPLIYGELVAQHEDLDVLVVSDRVRNTIQPRRLMNTW
jgi:hypothetical protein